MSDITPAGRDIHGRWVKGVSGNPRGGTVGPLRKAFEDTLYMTGSELAKLAPVEMRPTFKAIGNRRVIDVLTMRTVTDLLFDPKAAMWEKLFRLMGEYEDSVTLKGDPAAPLEVNIRYADSDGNASATTPGPAEDQAGAQ